MKINIRGIGFTLRTELKEMINSKVQKLKNLYDDIINIEISFKVNKSQNRDNKFCRIRLVIPGYDMLAAAHGQTFEAATFVAIEALERQIEKRKTKLIANRIINM